MKHTAVFVQTYHVRAAASLVVFEYYHDSQYRTYAVSNLPCPFRSQAEFAGHRVLLSERPRQAWVWLCYRIEL